MSLAEATSEISSERSCIKHLAFVAMKFSCLMVLFLIVTLSADVQECENATKKNGILTTGQESACKNDSQCTCTASTKKSTYMTSLCFTCSGCSRIPDWLPRNTTELNMSGNCLENGIDASFRHLPNLVSLDLSHCKIRRIRAGTFDGLTLLRVLNISTNPNIEKLSAELFSRLSNLSILVLRNIQNVCKIDGRFLLNLTGLSVFSYGKNHLINFPTFLSRQNNQLLPNLAKLNLEFNSIQALKKEHLRGLEILRILILNKNQISYIESGTFLNLTALFRLELNYNPLTKLEPDSFSSLSLEILSLAKSEYRPKDNIKLLWGLPNLKELNVSRSIGIFSAIAPLKNQTSLEVLSARQDDLFDEDVSNMLTNVPHLRYLDLTDNNINVLENIPFHKLKSLEVLLLGRNWLITVNATSLTKVTWAHLNRVDFSANPLICDCGIVWFRRWLNTTQVIVDRREYIRCSAPEEVKNQILSEIPHPTDMECFQQKSNESLVVGLIAILVLLVYLLSLIVSVFYRFRWHLNYWYFRHKVSNYYYISTYKHKLNIKLFKIYLSSGTNFLLLKDQGWQHIVSKIQLHVTLSHKQRMFQRTIGLIIFSYKGL